MPRLRNTVTGDKELDRALKTLDVKVQRRILGKAIREAAGQVRGAAARNAAKSSSKIANKIGVGRTRRKRGRASVAVFAPGRSDLGIAADDPYFYPAAIEFGAKPHFITAKAGGMLTLLGGMQVKSVRHPGVKARPFMRPAIVSERDDVARVFQSHLKQLIAKAKAPGGK